VIRAQDDPAAEAVTHVDYPSAADEPDHIRERRPHRQDEDLKMATDNGYW